jgi:hypothetical protein
VGKASTPGQCRSPGGTVPSHRTRSVDSFAKKNGKTQNRGRLPQMSNSDCRPGRAGGFPGCNNPDVILSERGPKRLPGSPKSAFALWGGAWGW